MPTLTYETTLTYGDDTNEAAVPCREPRSFTITYSESSIKRARIAPSAVDSPVLLDTVDAPKFLLVESLETDVTVKLSDGAATDIAPTAVASGAGWVVIANASGQPIDRILVTTPASPVEGALIRVMAFE